MSRTKLHIEPVDLDNLSAVLSMKDQKSYENEDELSVDLRTQYGINISSDKINTLLNLSERMGLIQDGELTVVAQDLCETARYNKQLFYELINIQFATEFFVNPSKSSTVSWSYYAMCKESAPNNTMVDSKMNRQELIQNIKDEARRKENDGFLPQNTSSSALSEKSFLDFRRIISMLDPLVYDGEKIQTRDYVELGALAYCIDRVYMSSKMFGHIDYGDLISLDDGDIVEFISNVLFVEEDAVSRQAEKMSDIYHFANTKRGYNVNIRYSNSISIDEI